MSDVRPLSTIVATVNSICSYVLHTYVYVYAVISDCSIVDGGWSSWKLGPCSKTCGGGIQNYTRVCNNPKPSCGGKKCEGVSSYTANKTCNDLCCPGNVTIVNYINYCLYVCGMVYNSL